MYKVELLVYINGSTRIKDMYKMDSNTLTRSITANIRSVFSAGVLNQRYNGSKITGPGVNIPTTNFPDGAPVITRTAVNPNNLTTGAGNQGGGVFSGNNDTEILVKEDPEIIISKNDPTTETIKNNPTTSGGTIYKNKSTESSKPIVTPTKNKGGQTTNTNRSSGTVSNNSLEEPPTPTRSSGTTRNTPTPTRSSGTTRNTNTPTRSSGTTRNTNTNSSNKNTGEQNSKNKNTGRNY
jgi:hypothetical protein